MTNDAVGLLYRLQRIELELKDLSQKAERSNEAQSLREAKARAYKTSRLAGAAQDAAREAQRRIRRLELELGTVEESLAKNERRLYGGEVTNVKELAALEEQVVSGKHRKSVLEEEALSAMEELDQRLRELKLARSAAAKAASDLKGAEVAYRRALEGWRHEQERLSGERDRLRKAVPADLLKLYDSLAQKLGGRAIAPVLEGRCGGCHVELPTAIRREQPAVSSRCPSCGRILWWPS